MKVVCLLRCILMPIIVVLPPAEWPVKLSLKLSVGSGTQLIHRELLKCSRANAMTREVVDDYFARLKMTLDKNGLVTASRQIFNCDETFLPLNIACEKVKIL